MKEYIYIYNIKQAQFYITEGDIKPTEIGISNKNNKIYFKFIREQTKNIFDQWCNQLVK